MERIRDFAAIDFETANGQRTSVCSVGRGRRSRRPSVGEHLPVDPSLPQLLLRLHYGESTVSRAAIPRMHRRFPTCGARSLRESRDCRLWRITRPSTRGVCGLSTPLRTTLSRLPFPVYVERFAPSDQRVAQLSAPYGLRSLRIPARTPPPCTGRRRSLCGDRPAAFRIAPRLIRTVRGFR